jgi:CheY-like chemotaxis protein
VTLSAQQLLELLGRVALCPMGVRLRIALDVLADAARGSALIEDRRASSRFRLDAVRLDPTGVARIPREGDASGALMLVWEILAARPLGGDGDAATMRARAAVQRALPEITRTLGDAQRGTRCDVLLAALTTASRGRVATHEDVRLALLAPRRAPDGASVESASPESSSLEASGVRPSPLAARPFAISDLARATGPARRTSWSGTLPAVLPEGASLGPQTSAWQAIANRAVAARRTESVSTTSTPGAKAPPFESGAPGSGIDSSARRSVFLVQSLDGERRRLAAALGDAGHRVVEFSDAEAALTAAAARMPAAIVADHDLRLQSGDDLARRVRKHPGALANAAFVLLVSPRTTRTKLAPFASGADLKLNKPVQPADLVTALGRLLALGPRLKIARTTFAALAGSLDLVLRGDLRAVPLSALLAVLEIERRTGLLRVSGPAGAAGLDFAAGLVVRGSLAGGVVTSLDAMRAMAASPDGAFSFHALPPRDPPPDAVAPQTLLAAATPLGGALDSGA